MITSTSSVGRLMILRKSKQAPPTTSPLSGSGPGNNRTNASSNSSNNVSNSVLFMTFSSLPYAFYGPSLRQFSASMLGDDNAMDISCKAVLCWYENATLLTRFAYSSRMVLGQKDMPMGSVQ